jgi:hypothetical protein
MRSRTTWLPTMWLVLVWVLVGLPRVAMGQTTGVFGAVSVDVQDPQHRPVPQADVTVRAQLSDWQAHSQTDDQGKFVFTTVPAGE